VKLLPPVRKTNCNVSIGGTLAHSEIVAGFDRDDNTVDPEQHQLEPANRDQPGDLPRTGTLRGPREAGFNRLKQESLIRSI
jgi:hypothetical protein